jgi:hypothetical protein
MHSSKATRKRRSLDSQIDSLAKESSGDNMMVWYLMDMSEARRFDREREDARREDERRREELRIQREEAREDAKRREDAIKEERMNMLWMHMFRSNEANKDIK